MEALNSKEKSTAIWNFIFLFILLIFIPISVIFYSFYKLPEALAKKESNKLIQLSDFAKTQDLLIRSLIKIDANFNLLAVENNNVNPNALITQITNDNLLMSNEDSSVLAKSVSTMIEHNVNHINDLIKTRELLKRDQGRKSREEERIKNSSLLNSSLPIDATNAPPSSSLNDKKH